MDTSLIAVGDWKHVKRPNIQQIIEDEGLAPGIDAWYAGPGETPCAQAIATDKHLALLAGANRTYIASVGFLSAMHVIEALAGHTQETWWITDSSWLADRTLQPMHQLLQRDGEAEKLEENIRRHMQTYGQQCYDLVVSAQPIPERARARVGIEERIMVPETPFHRRAYRESVPQPFQMVVAPYSPTRAF